jgi:hypothetical protein
MVARFARRIETPVLTDIRISFEGLEVTDLEPGRIPDLFAGQSLLIHGRYTRPQIGVVILEGTRNGRREILSRVAVLPEVAHDHAALGRLWARARIHRLQREMHAGPRPDVIEAITRLGLGYRLMTPWTSLVAVDSSVSNPYGPAAQMTIPVEMPEDVTYEGIFGYGRADRKLKSMSLPAMAPPAPLQEYNAAEAGSRRERSAGGQTSLASGKMPGELLMADKDEAASQDRREIFRRLTLSLDDGTDLVLEANGELWHRVAGRRTLTMVLTLDQLAQVESLLLQGGLKEATTGNQTGPGQGFHVETQSGATWLARDTSPALRRLATMLAGLAAV